MRRRIANICRRWPRREFRPGSPPPTRFAILLIGLVRKRGPQPEPLRADAQVISSILLAGSIAALGWSPLQEPALPVPMLLAAGRGWRVLGEAGHGDPATDPE